MALLRKAALRRPGIGMGGCIQHLSEEHGSPPNTQDPPRNPGAIPSVGWVNSLFRIKQTPYQPERGARKNTSHPDATRVRRDGGYAMEAARQPRHVRLTRYKSDGMNGRVVLIW